VDLGDLRDGLKRIAIPEMPTLAIAASASPLVPPVSPHFIELPEHLLTMREVADRLRVCRATVYKLCDAGELAHVRIANAIRVAPADLSQFIAGRRRR
jgi:excisionase family DNA binding protein